MSPTSKSPLVAAPLDVVDRRSCALANAETAKWGTPFAPLQFSREVRS